jgi:conjugative relaxase-like TrwC/TraI family protein
VARRVVEVHTAAVDGAVRYLEAHGVGAVRRRGPERDVVATTGFIGGVFTHGVSRNLDPHLHSHVVVANLVHGVDGRWSACDWRGLDAHRTAAEAVYEAHLRAGLSADLGVRWSGGWRRNPSDGTGLVAPSRTQTQAPEIVGVPPELLGEFSSRSAEIRQGVDALGARTAHGRHVVWASTRAPKASVPFGPLVAEWGRRARAAGAPLDLGDLSGRAIGSRSPKAFDEHRYAAAIAGTPHGGARRRDVVVAFEVAAPDGVLSPTLERLVGHWAPGDGSVGVAEPLHPRRTVVPAHHLLRALGPRPTDAGAHEIWIGAARTVEAYRARWGVGHAEAPLGPVANLATLPPARLADHVRTTRDLEAARARLGVRAPVEVELGRGL